MSRQWEKQFKKAFWSIRKFKSKLQAEIRKKQECKSPESAADKEEREREKEKLLNRYKEVVNIDGLSDQLIQAIRLLDTINKDIYELMRQDSYRRFLKDGKVQKFLGEMKMVWDDTGSPKGYSSRSSFFGRRSTTTDFSISMLNLFNRTSSKSQLVCDQTTPKSKK
eukprot:jgi/Bigna1/136734/aug1.35_g11442